MCAQKGKKMKVGNNKFNKSLQKKKNDCEFE